MSVRQSDNDSAFDAESQPSRSSNGTSSSGLRPVPIHMNLDADGVKFFRKAYGIEPILSTSQFLHLHPALAYERNTLEAAAIKKFYALGSTGWLADVGSAARHARLKDRIHCMAPQLQPGDAARLSLATRGGRSVCTHTLQQCDCLTFDALLFTHSAYYVAVPELMSAIEKTTCKIAYVVGHKFEEALGSFPREEGRYELMMVDGQVQVVMRVVGNPHSYTHPVLAWQDGSIVHDGTRHLDVEIVAKLGSTYLWSLTVSDHPVVVGPIGDFRQVLVDPNYSGPVMTSSADMYGRMGLEGNDLVHFPIDHLYAMGPFLFAENSLGSVVVPRAAICTVADALVQRTRDVATWNDTVAMMRRQLKSSRLPPEKRTVALIVGSALAFNYGVVTETVVSNHMSTRFSWLWALHSRTANLLPQATYNWRLYLLLLVVVWFVSLTVFLAVDWENRVIGIALLGTSSTSLVLFACGVCVVKRVGKLAVDGWSRNLISTGTTSSIIGRAQVPTTRRFLANTDLVEPLLGPLIEESVTVGVDPNPPKHPAKPPGGLLVGGMVFSSPVPTIVAPSQEADVVALTNRTAVPRTSPTSAALERFNNPSLSARVELMEIRIHDNDRAFENWVSNAKYSARTRAKFREVREKVRHADVKSEAADVFTKGEKGKSANRVAPPKEKPRVVTNVPDAVKVMAGPACSLIYHMVRRVWNGIDSKFLYASGLPLDKIGAIVDHNIARLGGEDEVVAISDDFSCYDSTVQVDLLKEREIYLKMGMKPKSLAWLRSVKSTGVSKHGVRYDLKKTEGADGKRKEEQLYSGVPDTNLIGTIINAEAHESGLPPDVDFFMMICGDDNFLLMRKVDLTPEVLTGLTNHLVALGLKPTPIVSSDRSDWEFCSKLFWHATDPISRNVVTVLGPKVGRLLHRIGWNVTKPGAANFRGTLEGLRDDVAHVPMVSEFVLKGLDVTEGVKARKSREYEELGHVSRRYETSDLNMRILRARYSLGEAHLEEFRRVLAAVDASPMVLSFSWLESMVERDA